MQTAGQRSKCFLAFLMLTLLAPAITVAQSTGSIVDVKTVVGRWSGTGYSSAGTNALVWTIKDDGMVDVIVRTPQGPREGVAKMSVKDGKLFYESGTSSGPVTLHKDGGRRVLKYEAVMKRDNSRRGAELTFEK